MASDFFAVVASIRGQAWCVDSNARRSPLTAGHRLHAGTQLLTGSNAMVKLRLPEAADVVVGAERLLTITEELALAPTIAECAVSAELASLCLPHLSRPVPPAMPAK